MINDGFNITGRLQVELNGEFARVIDNLDDGTNINNINVSNNNSYIILIVDLVE